MPEPAPVPGPGGVPDRAEARRRVPRADRERDILEVARRTFAARGYHEATMDEIADAVGVSKQLVYNYVGSKEQLYLACYREAARTLQDQLEEVAAGGAVAPDVALWRGLLAFFAFVDEHREAWSIVYGPGAARGASFAGEVAALRSELAAQLVRLFVGAHSATAPPAGSTHVEIAALSLVGAAELLATWWLDHPEVPRDKMALRLMNVSWMGLGELLHGGRWRPPEE